MNRRFICTGMLLLALLAGAWGNVLAAAFCPHKAQEEDHACCHAQTSHHMSSHHQMGDMQAKPAAEQKMEVLALGQPIESCAHCINHSQPGIMTATLRDADQSRRNAEVAAPFVTGEIVSAARPFVPNISARGHAPPGANSSARYILLNIFRI